MKIIAIDPGTVQSAFVSWDTETDAFVDVQDEFRLGLVPNKDLHMEAFYLLMNVQPDLIAIEMVQSYGLTVGRTTFETVLFVGKLTEKFHNCYTEYNCLREFSIKYYGRPTIKAQVGGKKDSEVRASLRLRYGEAKKGEKLYGVKKDIWSALAVAAALTERPNLKEW
jgi:hypothetical protein